MKIRLIEVTLIFLIFGTLSVVGEIFPKASNNESICNGTCNCTTYKEQFGSVFRASCEGDGIEVLFLSENLLAEPLPGRTKKIYVNVSNQSQVIVTDGFLSKWRAYSSCSLSLKFVSKIEFPKVCPKMAEKNALSHIFAGIEIDHSEIEFISSGIFEEKDKASLTLTKATILSLNLKSIFGKTPLGNLNIYNSTIGTIHGNNDDPSVSLSRGTFTISYSQIGQIWKNGLHFWPGKNAKPIVSIDRITVGILNPLSISLVGNIKLKVMHCHVGEIHPKAMFFSNGAMLVARYNKFGVYKQSLVHISCDNGSNVIYKNTIIPLDSLQCERPRGNDSFHTDIEDYLKASCENNCIYTYRPPLAQIFPSMVTYVVMGVCLILTVLVAIIAGRLIWIYIFSLERSRKISDGISSIYFTPHNIPPREMNVFDSHLINNTNRKRSKSLSYNKENPDDAFLESNLINEYY